MYKHKYFIDLLKNMFLPEQDRYSIDQVISHPFWKKKDYNILKNNFIISINGII